jgi:lantibiotic modifying enzyme
VPAATPVTIVPPQAQEKVSRTRLLTGVQAIGEHLAATAIYGSEDVTWLGMELLNQSWALRQIGTSFSSGLCGISLFLAYAGAITGNEANTQIARRATKSIVGQMEFLEGEMTQIGALEGWGGILYTLTHLSSLWGDDNLMAQARGVAEIIRNSLSQDAQLSIGRGSAGALVTLLALHRTMPSTKVLDVAILCGEHLLQAAQPTEQGLSWASLAGGQPENEFLYGRAGIAWALLELAAATDDERYTLAAKTTLAHQATQHPFTKEIPPTVGLSSALGEGFAWLSLLKHIDGPDLHQKLQRTINGLLAHQVAQSHSLADGTAGILDLLLQANQAQQNTRYALPIERIGAGMLESVEQQRWHCSSPSSVEIPGLITGLSGIGYSLLRLADPAHVPPFLLLAPPSPQFHV